MTPPIPSGLPEGRPHASRLVRLACLGGGFAALALGLAGVVLPVLPTTPFVLLATACFARSSERLHGWLLHHPIAGPLIREWRQYRAMPRRAKRVAYGLMLVSFASSILVMESPWHRAMLAGLGLALGYWLWRVPIREPDPETPPG
jgi:uncharacterized membrane protein YbaN (DUF454 family)